MWLTSHEPNCHLCYFANGLIFCYISRNRCFEHLKKSFIVKTRYISYVFANNLKWLPLMVGCLIKFLREGKSKSVTRRGENLEIFRPPGKMWWTSFKTIGHVQKMWAPCRKLLAPPGVPSWLRAWGK